MLGSALSAMPACAVDGKRVGRRRGFMTGSLIAIIGSATCALGIARGQLPLYCFGTAIVGVYTAFGLQYRFAAAEVAAAGVQGQGDFPGAGRRHRRRLHRTAPPACGRRTFCRSPFLGSFLVLSAIALIALAVQSRVQRAGAHRRRARRRRAAAARRSLRQPCSSSRRWPRRCGYGIMNLLMTATPLAMRFCGHPFSRRRDSSSNGTSSACTRRASSPAR